MYTGNTCIFYDCTSLIVIRVLSFSLNTHQTTEVVALLCNLLVNRLRSHVRGVFCPDVEQRVAALSAPLHNLSVFGSWSSRGGGPMAQPLWRSSTQRILAWEVRGGSVSQRSTEEKAASGRTRQFSLGVTAFILPSIINEPVVVVVVVVLFAYVDLCVCSPGWTWWHFRSQQSAGSDVMEIQKEKKKNFVFFFK